MTSVDFMSGSKPLPRNKPEIAAAHALAGQYLGMKLIYLEGGSGADTLWGGSGSDIYVYSNKEDSPAGSGDIIKDYEQDEQFDISNLTTTFNIVSSFTGSTTPEVTFNAATKKI